MKTLFLLATLLLSCASSHARLGETVAECKARYGEELDRNNAKRYIAFHKSGFIIMVYFDEDLLCEKIIFSLEEKAKMSDTQKEILVASNLGDDVEYQNAIRHEIWTAEGVGGGAYDVVYNTFTFLTAAAFERMVAEKEAAEKESLKGF